MPKAVVLGHQLTHRTASTEKKKGNQYYLQNMYSKNDPSRGVAFKNILLPESFEALLTLPSNGNQSTRLILDSRLGMSSTLTCFLFKIQLGYLLLGERARFW